MHGREQRLMLLGHLHWDNTGAVWQQVYIVFDMLSQCRIALYVGVNGGGRSA